MQAKPGLITAILVATALGAPVNAAAGSAVDLSAADNAFGFRLLNAVQKSAPHRNTILSPVSAAIDLSMALNGATGQTRQEMLDALSLSGADLEAINEANAKLLEIIRTPPKGIVLSVADALWVNDRLARLRPDYLKRIRAAYAARTAELDFSKPDAVRSVNDWASKQTHGKIANVIDRLDPAEVALLLNAVYFKGKWAHQFEKSRTRPHEFTLASGTLEQVPRMVESGSFDYLETPDLQAIRLPFGTGDLVMEVILPSKSSSLEALESQLTPEHWVSWKAHLVRRSGTIELPRFELKARYRLKEALQALGMDRVFHAGGNDAAQLSDMLTPVTGNSAFYISSVIQSAYWKVNEEGSEAAAATTIHFRTALAAPRPQPFHMIVDRPFFCAIEDQRSGTLLFVGAVYDPR